MRDLSPGERAEVSKILYDLEGLRQNIMGRPSNIESLVELKSRLDGMNWRAGLLLKAIEIKLEQKDIVGEK